MPANFGRALRFGLEGGLHGSGGWPHRHHRPERQSASGGLHVHVLKP